jgi:hypothetical protein
MRDNGADAFRVFFTGKRLFLPRGIDIRLRQEKTASRRKILGKVAAYAPRLHCFLLRKSNEKETSLRERKIPPPKKKPYVGGE